MAEGGPMLVIAGAGSGKTHTVTYRLARLIEIDERPDRILLLTFTNKAAGEMLRRAEDLVKSDARHVCGGTFHHLGNLIIRRHAEEIGLSGNFSILDREDSANLIDTCVAEYRVKQKDPLFPKGGVLRDILSYSINTGRSIEEVVLNRYCGFQDYLREIEAVCNRYRGRKNEINVLDFDDLLTLLLRLLEECPEIRLRYQEQFRHILVDEYQDINQLQGRLIDLLAEGYRNLMVVGDDAQSIYSFRGADLANILDFPKRYSDASIYRLELNYRSSPEILQLANASISVNTQQFEKRLRAEKQSGEIPAVVPVRDVLQQADFVCQRVSELRDEGISLDEIGVLYRAHYHSMELQMELARRGVHFQVRSGPRFFEQLHVKDVTAHLKVIVNPRDEVAWKRILQLLPGVGIATARKIWQAVCQSADPIRDLATDKFQEIFPKRTRGKWERLAENLQGMDRKKEEIGPAEMIHFVVEQGYQDYLESNFSNFSVRMEDLDQLARFAEGFGRVNTFLSELALINTVGEDNVEDEGLEKPLVLSTIHQAKGLEWKVVFVLWLVEERFPSSLALRESDGDEEERRLFYVAVTRAREKLYLCHPLLDLGRPQTKTLTESSRFLKELPELVYEQWEIEEEIFEDQKIRNDIKEENKCFNRSYSSGENDTNWVDEYFDQTDS